MEPQIGDRVQIVSFALAFGTNLGDLMAHDGRGWNVAPDVYGTLTDIRWLLDQRVYEVEVQQEIIGSRKTVMITRHVMAHEVVSVEPLAVELPASVREVTHG